jgi:hypothetical protein
MLLPSTCGFAGSAASGGYHIKRIKIILVAFSMVGCSGNGYRISWLLPFSVIHQ